MEEIIEAFTLLDVREKNTAQKEILVYLKKRFQKEISSESFSSENIDENNKDLECDTVIHQEILAKALESGLESDILFVLGPEGKKVKAHQFILSIFSPVLRKIFAKNVYNEVCRLPELDPNCFKLVLKYVYTGESGASISEALPMLEIATNFKIPGLIEECSEILEKNLTIENVIPIFQQAMKSTHPNLIVTSLDYICENGSKSLLSKDFLELRTECIVEIVKQDGLKVEKEVDVFDAVCRWGEAEAKRRKLDIASPDTLRSVLEKVLKYVRFPLMSQMEFSFTIASNKNILTMEEVLSLFVYFSISEENRFNIPEGAFITTPRASASNMNLESTVIPNPIPEEILNEGIVTTFFSKKGPQIPTFSFSETNLPEDMYGACAVYDEDESIYLVGGCSISNNYLNSILKFSISSQEIKQVAILPAFCYGGFCFWDGEGIVHFGGHDGKTHSKKIFRYVPGMCVATEIGNLSQANHLSSIFSVKPGEALIFGGSLVGDSVVHYSSEGAKELQYKLPQTMFGHSSTYYSNKTESSVLLFNKKSIYKYDIETGKTLTLSDKLPITISHSTAVSVGKYSYIFGGSSGKSLGVIRFDPEIVEAVEISVSNFPTKLSHSSAVFVKKQNRAYLFGGLGIPDGHKIMRVQF